MRGIIMPPMEQKIKRTMFTVQGQVQGVGFRPFVWRLATGLGLTGLALNSSAGVRVEVQGSEDSIENFRRGLLENPPPLARIIHLEEKDLPLQPDEGQFLIKASEGHAGQNVLVSPDVGICQDCLADIRDPANFRHAYPFANCTNCGPRFSITRSLPYDRATTSMGCFPLCPLCGTEYANPANRRFHAQPIACPQCGPHIWFVARTDADIRSMNENRPDALAGAGRLLLSGGILALKGLGGFQLACDARNGAAVQLLRERKKRPHKALAVMAHAESLETFCSPAREHLACLNSPARPIVLCPRDQEAPGSLAAAIAPDCMEIGVMTPYTPLHALLLDWLASHGMGDPVLVMTSANPAGEPICLGNREALERLGDLADGWLLHNRDILERVDDSVVRLLPAPADTLRAVPLRRARGYVPLPLPLPRKSQPVLGMGAELKATFCLTRGNLAFPGQHIGNLTSAATLDFYEHALGHLSRLLETTPRIIVADSHPDFISSALARDLGKKYDIPVLNLQHHAAHAAAVLGENGHTGPALAICLDGSGLGPDGSIWGGEILWMDLSSSSWERLGGLSTFPLPGGEGAIRHPWRLAVALGHHLHESSPYKKDERIIRTMLEKNINCPPTSSAGRLFDAFAALLGLCDAITYEGQAAIRLEQAAAQWLAAHEDAPEPFFHGKVFLEGGLYRINSRAFFAAGQKAFGDGRATGELAAAFHMHLAEAFADMAALAARDRNTDAVGLSGGVFQNRPLVGLLIKELESRGLEVLCHRELPPGDGCISYGQAVWGNCLQS